MSLVVVCIAFVGSVFIYYVRYVWLSVFFLQLCISSVVIYFWCSFVRLLLFSFVFVMYLVILSLVRSVVPLFFRYLFSQVCRVFVCLSLFAIYLLFPFVSLCLSGFISLGVQLVREFVIYFCTAFFISLCISIFSLVSSLFIVFVISLVRQFLRLSSFVMDVFRYVCISFVSSLCLSFFMSVMVSFLRLYVLCFVRPLFIPFLVSFFRSLLVVICQFVISLFRSCFFMSLFISFFTSCVISLFLQLFKVFFSYLFMSNFFLSDVIYFGLTFFIY